MGNCKESLLSRREFARRAAMLSASLLPAGVILEVGDSPAEAVQMPENLPKLTPEGKVEADSRYQQILSQYSSRFDSEQKALVQGLCIFVQPALERLRAFHLENGDAPAVYLKPLMERDKKPSPSPAAGPAPEAATKS